MTSGRHRIRPAIQSAWPHAADLVDLVDYDGYVIQSCGAYVDHEGAWAPAIVITSAVSGRSKVFPIPSSYREEEGPQARVLAYARDLIRNHVRGRGELHELD